jgi:hypothetical protein
MVGPTGLAYDAKRDILYVASVVSTIGTHLAAAARARGMREP